MIHRARWSMAAFACLGLGASCGTAQTTRRVDYLGAARAGIARVEQMSRTRSVVLVVPERIDSASRSVLCELRRCVRPAEVPATDLYLLPEGYFVIKEFRVNGNEGVLAGVLGPGLRPRMDREAPGSGTRYRVELARPYAEWVTGTVELGYD
jgi:hypothetical protein